MITTNQIIDAINKMLIGKYPKRTVYINLCPKGFDRPNFLIEAITSKIRAANRNTVEITAYFTVTCFEKIDSYSNSAMTELLDIQNGVMDLFNQGYIKVSDRSLDIQASTGGVDFDCSYVDLQLKYYDDRTDEKKNVPMVKNIDLSLKEV